MERDYRMAEVLTDLDSLAVAVLEVDENVKDYLDVAVILEVIGVTRETAKRYGYKDIFNLAEAVFKAIRHYQLRGETAGTRKKTRIDSIIEALRLFAGGMTLGFPWVIILLVYIIFKVSWLPISETPLVSTSVNLALVASIISTSWISPLFMRKLFYFMYQKMYSAVRKILVAYFISGFFITLLIAILLVMFTNTLGIYPDWWITYFTIFFIALSLLWLTTAPLYALRLHIPLILTYLCSLLIIGISYTVMRSIPQKFMAHIYGTIGGSAIAIIYLTVYLYLRSRFKPESYGDVKIRLPFTLYLGMPYSIVNLLYFIFIFTDRFLVWYRGSPYLFLVDFLYETPASLSLLIITVPFGVMNYYIQRFYRYLSGERSEFNSFQIDEYRESIKKIYLKMQTVIFLSGFSFWVILFFLIRNQIGDVTIFTYLSIGHIFLISIISNILVFFCMHRPVMPLLPMLLGTLLNFTLGAILIKMYGVKYVASMSYMVSSIIMAIFLITMVIETIIKKIDYYYYSAF